MKSFKKNSNSILFLYPCYQYFFYERIYNFKKLNNFFDQLIKIPDNRIFIKFHPRHYNKSDQIFEFINKNNIEFSVEDDLIEHIKNVDTVIGFEPSGALVESIILKKKVVYINDYINIYENERSLKKFIKIVNSLSFSQFLLIAKSGKFSFNNLCKKDFDSFYQEYKSLNIEYIFNKIINN